MKPKAKFKIGQTVFYLCDNAVYEDMICGIFATTGGVYYYVGELNANDEIGRPYNYQAEDTCFPTKEALLKSL